MFFKITKRINNNLTLKKEDTLKNFLLVKNSKESEKLVEIYNIYIKQQNDLINEILNIKHNEKGFPLSEPINVQSIEKNEIFSFELEKTCFTEIILKIQKEKATLEILKLITQK